MKLFDFFMFLSYNFNIKKEKFMGLFDYLSKKISNVMEKGISKNLSGESKIEYEKQKQEQKLKAEIAEKNSQAIQAELNLKKTPATKNDLNNLEILLDKISVLDNTKTWVGGFENYKLKQNSKIVNMFSGNKNIRIFAVNAENYYYCKFDGENFLAYKKISKENINKVEIENYFSKKFLVKLNDGSVFTIDVTENKDKLANLKEILIK